MATHRRMVAFEGPDFYRTPAWGTIGLLTKERFEGTILEPCCGDGAISIVLNQCGYQVVSSDLYDRGYGSVRDFFDIQDKYDNIVTNPPFNIAEDVLEHALKIANKKVCLLLRTAFLESARRYKKFFSHRPPSRLHVFSKRLTMYPAGQPIKGKGTTSYAWFVWDSAERYFSSPIWDSPIDEPTTRISWIV